MTLSATFLLAKKIHRWSLLVTIFLTLIMGGSGTLLKYPNLGQVLNIDMGSVRYLHRELSVFFTFSLLVMSLTGLSMYFIPELIKQRAKNKTKVPVTTSI